MSKTMTQTIRGHNLRVTVLVLLLAVLVALASMLQPAATTGASNPGIHATSAGGAGAPTITQDPYIERHAEVVQRLGGGSLR